MKSLVTGANGFVGSAVARCLLAAGHEVRALARAGSDRRNLMELPIEVVEGDLRDVPSLKRAVKGCDSLFHVAADYRLWVPNPAIMYVIHVQGTQALIQAGAEAGMTRMVYTSSVATLGFKANSQPADEETPSDLAAIIGHYKRSKFLAEQVVRELVYQHQLPLVIVNPSTPIGPRDVKPTPTGRIVLDTLRGKMPAYVDTGLNVAHVDDIAQGHLLACQHGKAGQRYILGGDNMTLLEILQIIDEITGKPTKRRRLPVKLMLPIAHTLEMVAKITRTEPRATVDSVQMAKKKMFFSSAKAEQELGYQHRSAKAAICDAIEWFKHMRYC